MDWIVFFQNQYDRVTFISSQNSDERDSLPYYKFLEFINKEFPVAEFVKLKDQLDRFKIICLLKDGTWEIQNSLDYTATFKELHDINNDILKEEDITPTEIQINKSKDWLDKIFKKRRVDNEFKSGNRAGR